MNKNLYALILIAMLLCFSNAAAQQEGKDENAIEETVSIVNEQSHATAENKIVNVQNAATAENKLGPEKPAGVVDPAKAGFDKARDEALLKACAANMKVIEGACELYLMEIETTGEILMTAEDLVTKKYIARPKTIICPASEDKKYELSWKKNQCTIKCPVHGKTLPEDAKK